MGSQFVIAIVALVIGFAGGYLWQADEVARLEASMNTVKEAHRVADVAAEKEKLRLMENKVAADTAWRAAVKWHRDHPVVRVVERVRDHADCAVGEVPEAGGVAGEPEGVHVEELGSGTAKDAAADGGVEITPEECGRRLEWAIDDAVAIEHIKFYLHKQRGQDDAAAQ